MSVSKRELRERLSESAEYRHAYAEDFANTFVATQIAVIREDRGLTQKQLGERLGDKGKAQPRVSLIENVNYGRWSVRKLHEVARALGVRLKISFETFGALLDESVAFSRDNLKRVPFENDELFHDRSAGADIDFSSPILRWNREVFAAWLDRNEWRDGQFIQWLLNHGMPTERTAIEPYQRLFEALQTDRDRFRLADRLAQTIRGKAARALSGDETRKFKQNAFYLASLIEFPTILGEPLWEEYEALRSHPGSLDRAAADALRSALCRNQIDDRMTDDWNALIEHDEHPLLPGNAMDGWAGILYLPPRPNWQACRAGLKLMELSIEQRRPNDKERLYRNVLRTILKTYPKDRWGLAMECVLPSKMETGGPQDWAIRVAILFLAADLEIRARDLAAKYQGMLRGFLPRPESEPGQTLSEDDEQKLRPFEEELAAA